MRYVLKDYQRAAAVDVLKALRRATRGRAEDNQEHWSIALSAPTGAGKTVIASAVIETLFDGADKFPADPSAVVLWVTDNPDLNEQTKRKMLQAASGLTPSRLVTIDASFDQAVFDPARVYFLNIQKLARTNPLARSNVDRRRYSLWETLSNTIESSGAHLYVIIDEAHRGMRSESDRKTIVSRIINGQAGINPPAPVVWGISATPERFQQAVERWDIERIHKSVAVPLDEVRASGLLKDKVVLDNPGAGQMRADTTLIRGAVAQVQRFETDWRAYTSSQNEPAVVPALVVQVPNAPSDAEMAEYLSAIFGEWPELSDRNVVNTFSDHTALSVAGHTIRYMSPQDVQDDDEVRVVLCKDAVSTGWDCPRAEVLVSLRKAHDYTYIAQLIGRMVRTPLARRVPTDHTLNDVHCYLPLFSGDEVEAIVRRFVDGRSDEPPVEVITNPVRVWRNEAVPPRAFELVEQVPTYVVPGRIYRTQIARLHTLAALLAGDHVIEDAATQVKIHLNGVLVAQRERLEKDGTFQRDLNRVGRLKVERTFALLSAETMDDLSDYEGYELERDDNNIADLFKVALRKLPEGVAKYYWNSLLDGYEDDDVDSTRAKAETVVLALHPEVVEAVEAAAEQLARTWLRECHRSISKLPDAKKANYEAVRRETRKPELTDLILPESRVVAESERWPLHLLAAEEGMYPGGLKGWEKKVLVKELADKDLVAWYRNPTGGNASLRVPYRGVQFDRAMYPDFILFHQTDDGLRPSIVDPHGFHLSDAAAKLRGLAEYARAHGDYFDRIESVVEIRNRLVALDLKSDTVRDEVEKTVDGGVEGLYEEFGGQYL